MARLVCQSWFGTYRWCMEVFGSLGMVRRAVVRIGPDRPVTVCQERRI